MQNTKKIKEGFFVRRPVLSTVISILITLVGVIAVGTLPIAQYPDLIPPQVTINASYPGASAETVAATVAAPLEQQINGVDNMLYLQSVSSSSGDLVINVTFNLGTDPDQATIDVNNRVQLASTQLPQDVTKNGLSVTKQSPSMLKVYTLYSPDERYDVLYLSNYALINVADELKRVKGVGDVQVFGAKDYSMRIWLKPDRMADLKLTPADIASAITAQNSQFAVGSIGAEPLKQEVPITWRLNTEGRLVTAEEFGNIIIRSESDGSVLYLKDVARIELGAINYGFQGKYNGYPAQPIGIFLAPGANALETSLLVDEAMENMKKNFPIGVDYSSPYDTTKFVEISIDEVIKTLLEAMLLVFLVVYLFLQNWRATLIPCLAVPVSILGTFAGMYVLGFSINTLTLFGMVLAIGIVVDDAIVVLENVERIMHTEKCSVRRATAIAMNEVTGPVIAIVLVLCSVFIPIAFLGGLAGEMYKQFAITIAISVTISGVVALSFTPALCVLFLKPTHAPTKGFFAMFNRFFDKVTNTYIFLTERLMRNAVITIVLFCVLGVSVWQLFEKVPTGLVPEEDQGYILALTIMPEGASLERTAKFLDELDKKMMQDPSVDTVMSFAGMDILSGVAKTSAGTTFITMKPWNERPTPDMSSQALVGKFMRTAMAMPEGLAIAFNPPPISGMSNTGGFEAYIQNRTGASYAELADVMQKFIAELSKRPELQGVNSTFNVNSPQAYIDLDREKARVLGVSVPDVFSALGSNFGLHYVNDFNLYGRTFKVAMQADAEYRSHLEDINEIYVRNNLGEMVPVSSLVTVEQISAPQIVERFNAFPAAKITGNPAAGFSSGQAIQLMEELALELLPEGYQLAWTGQSYQEKISGQDNTLVFVLGLLMVFLILAAQYESWSLPLAVITAVPFAVFGALVGTGLRGYSNDVYFQVALITLIGLSSKNAILIVEFAVEKYREGLSLYDAAVTAARLRFRPIIMTSLAFILGCVPLAISTGAGAASRHAIGTAVIGGMLAATILAPLFVPFCFRLIMATANKLFPPKKDELDEFDNELDDKSE